jgi:phosphoribosylaminoimidazolecarboxamide formyltransferase/IMP cyclohydrolase
MPAVVIVKHANPCGVAVAATIEEAWERALAADPVSAFGCVALLNRDVQGALGARIAEHFVEVLMAPGFEAGAVEALRKKQALRILSDTERRSETPGERDYKRVLGGMLVQERDSDIEDREEMQVVAGEVTEQQWGDLLFAWRVCKHVSSNAIVIARDLQTIGVGAGQMSRVDSVKIAVAKAQEHGHDLHGAVLASDAFFPFADGPQIALDAGIAAIIQPGGSKRDAEVVAAVDAAGAAMVLTGRRHFRH